MKLYSRQQVIVLCAAVVACALVAGVLATELVLAPRGARALASRAEPTSSVARSSSSTPVAIVPVQYNTGGAGRAGDFTQDEQNNIEIYDRTNKAVVYITTVTIEYSWMFEAVPREGTGSGVIIDQDGHILTNYHVIKGADQIRITLADGTEVEGKTIGSDPENDMAVVKFSPRGKALTTVP
jgi:S1-C subfamily serine protease